MSIADLNNYLSKRFSKTHNDLPGECWAIEGGSFLYLEFMMHDVGCWVILSCRNGGEETGRINLGTYKAINDIENLIKHIKTGI